MRIHRAALLIPALLFLTAAAHAQWTWSPQTGRWINLKNLPKETPQLQIEYARSLLLSKDYKPALRETQKFDEFYSDSELADQNQFLRAEIRQHQGRLMVAAKDYQQVLTSYPETSLYDEAIEKQYEIGDTYYEMGQRHLEARWRLFRKRPLKRAIEVYGMVVDNQPFTPTAAEAQYKMGLCHYTRKEYIEAAFEYRRVLEDYSGSDWVDEAGFGLAMCYYDDSLPAEYDQTPSQLAIDAIDAFVERYPSDSRNADLGERRSEMWETIAEQRLKTAEFYEKRRDFVAARIYYSLVVDEFSGTAAAAKAQTWLSAHPDAGVDTRLMPRKTPA